MITSHLPIECVTVCVDYGDFLREIVPFNAPHFERWIVVTEDRDEETRAICHKFGLTCLLSKDHKAGGPFNKGALVDRGLQVCKRSSWRLHLDSDIVLPGNFRRLLSMAKIKEDCLYGADRVNITSPEQWALFKKSGWLSHEGNNHYNCIDLPEGIPVGARWCSWRTGYVPIGYFQLWHSSQDEAEWVVTKTYPIGQGDACHSDVQFAVQWDRHKRILLPEVICVHLDSVRANTGANWRGRITPRFGTIHPVGDCCSY